MLGFPKSTEFGKRIQKQKFYENIDISPALKRVFVEQIKTVYWRNKLAADTINVAAGEQVLEIEVFEVRLTQYRLDEAVLRQIDQEIPYHILFVLTCEDKVQAWIGYKEAAESRKNAFKVSGYYHTDWVPEGELTFRLDGLNMDAVYENLVRQIAGDALGKEQGESLKDSVAREEQKQQLEKEIAALERRMRTERQSRKKWELHQKILELKECSKKI